jgi:hypothetical protein
MILREQIHPVIQRALYRKIDAINRIKVGEVNGNNYFDLGALNILGPTTEPGTNPVEQILTRSCWAKVSAAVFDTKFDYGKALSKVQAGIKRQIVLGTDAPVMEEPDDIMVSLSSYRDSDGNLINQPLSFRNGFDEKNYSDSMLRGHAGITSITSDYKNFFIKESVVNFICPDPDTFQDISDIFLKHGQYVSLEFGWGIESPAQMPKLNSSELRKLSQNIRARNLRGAGNYQCLVGVVSNFSFDQRPDGGYEGSFTITSAGKNILHSTIPTGNLEDSVTFAQRKKIAQGENASEEQKEDWELLRKNFATFNAVIKNLDSVVDEHLTGAEFQLDYTTERSAQGQKNFENSLKAAENTYKNDPEKQQKNIKDLYERTLRNNKGAVLYQYKDGAMIINTNLGVKGGKIDGVRRFVSWGWFEDYILNSFFSYELRTNVKLGEVRSTTNNELNRCQTSNNLSSMGLNSIILPGKTIRPKKLLNLDDLPQIDTLKALSVSDQRDENIVAGDNVTLIDGIKFEKRKETMDKNTAININRLGTALNVFDKTFKRFEEQKITRTEQDVRDSETNEATGDTIITTTGVNTGRHGFIRNMVFNIDYIAESFDGVSSLEIGLRKFWAKVSGEYGGFWNFGIANDEDSGGKIGIIDTYYNPQPDLPTMLENRSKREDFVNYKRKKDIELITDTTDKMFTFPLYSKDSIVKDFSLSVNLSPEAVTLAVYGSHSDKEVGGDSNKGISDPAVRAYSLLLNKNFDPERKGDSTVGRSSIMSGIKTPLEENGKGYASKIERFGKLEELRKGEGILFSNIPDIQDDTKKILTDLLQKEAAEKEGGLQTNVVYDIDNINQELRDFFVYNPATGTLKDSFKYFMISTINKSESPNIDSNYTKLKPIIPLDLDLTIDGVGGLKPGDLFRVDYLPQPYREFCYFIIFNVSQEISNSGWSTKIKAKAIADFEKLRSPQGKAYHQESQQQKQEEENPQVILLDNFIDFAIKDEVSRVKASIDSLKMIEDAGYSGQVIRAQMYRDLFGAKSSQDKKNLTSFTVKNKRAFTMINTETDVA